jgi:hypothetical protein
MSKEELLMKQFKLLNHDNSITKDLEIGKVYMLKPSCKDLEIGKVYMLKPSWFKINGRLKHSWILSIGNVSSHFSDENIDRYFERVGTDIIGYGQTY